MTFDTIAFTQDELDDALNLGYTSIGLCDNNFTLPQIADVTYISIGKISAKAKFKKSDMKIHNINCIGFLPIFAPQIFNHTSNPSSLSSYITSYQYEYEYQTSYSSYTTSMQSSFATSFVTGSSCIFINGYGINLI